MKTSFRPLILASLILTSFSAAALSLEEAPDPNTDRLPINADSPAIPCPDILARTKSYAGYAQSNDQNILAYMQLIAQTLNKNYAQLQPLEGSADSLPVGTFLPLKDSGGDLDISTIAIRAQSNSDYLAGLLKDILQQGEKCKIMNTACGDVFAKLQSYDKNARSHDDSITAFLGQVTGRLADQHEHFAALEGSVQGLPEGTFTPLQNDSDKVSALTDAAYDNAAGLAGEMSRILMAVQTCANKANK